MTTILLQKRLNKLGFGPLKEDGRIGTNTISAVKAFQKSRGLVVDGLVGPKTLAALKVEVKTKPPVPVVIPPYQPITPVPERKLRLLTTQEILMKYGAPGPAKLVVVDVPFPLIIGWDKTKYAKKIQVHKLVADSLVKALTEILEYYGIEKIKELQIDDYWGCYNFRKMRGGSDWSRHSWGIAIDLDADRNALHETSATARFARAEYKPMIDIFYKHGWIGLGPTKNYDWMHFQIGH